MIMAIMTTTLYLFLFSLWLSRRSPLCTLRIQPLSPLSTLHNQRLTRSSRQEAHHNMDFFSPFFLLFSHLVLWSVLFSLMLYERKVWRENREGRDHQDEVDAIDDDDDAFSQHFFCSPFFSYSIFISLALTCSFSFPGWCDEDVAGEMGIRE